MKIHSDSQKPNVTQVETKGETAAAPVAVKQKKARKPAGKGDSVDFSATALEGKLKAQQAAQAERMDTIKERVKSGTYEVDSRDVAEKMLAGGKKK